MPSSYSRMSLDELRLCAGSARADGALVSDVAMGLVWMKQHSMAL